MNSERVERVDERAGGVLVKGRAGGGGGEKVLARKESSGGPGTGGVRAAPGGVRRKHESGRDGSPTMGDPERVVISVAGFHRIQEVEIGGGTVGFHGALVGRTDEPSRAAGQRTKWGMSGGWKRRGSLKTPLPNGILAVEVSSRGGGRVSLVTIAGIQDGGGGGRGNTRGRPVTVLWAKTDGASSNCSEKGCLRVE